MAADAAWAELGARRFPGIPEDCGDSATPGIVDRRDFRNWALRPTTDDQYRLERYIDRYDLRSKRVLHIGIGNSGLAQRFEGRVQEIVGTTVDQSELDHARGLAIPAYSPVLQNKYRDEPELCPGVFDFIVDNNPTSSCCCLQHLAAVFELYSAKLADDGQVVTDREGLGWTPPGGNPLFRFDFDDLVAICDVAGFTAYRATSHVYVLARSAPRGPGVLPILRHHLRRARQLPSSLAAELLRISRRLIELARE
jgi:hypothetical protein